MTSFTDEILNKYRRQNSIEMIFKSGVIESTGYVSSEAITGINERVKDSVKLQQRIYIESLSLLDKTYY